MVSGCSDIGDTTHRFDLFTKQFDLVTGEPIDGTEFTVEIPDDEEYTAFYRSPDSEINLFGWDNNSNGPHTLLHHSYNQLTEQFSDLVIEAEDVSGSNSYIPFSFQNLSNGRILSIFTKDSDFHHYKILDDISEVYDLNPQDELPLLYSWVRDFVELNDNIILG